MSKWVEVVTETVTVYAVEIGDHETIENAEKYALDECGTGANCIIDSTLVVNDLKAKTIAKASGRNA